MHRLATSGVGSRDSCEHADLAVTRWLVRLACPRSATLARMDRFRDEVMTVEVDLGEQSEVLNELIEEAQASGDWNAVADWCESIDWLGLLPGPGTRCGLTSRCAPSAADRSDCLRQDGHAEPERTDS